MSVEFVIFSADSIFLHQSKLEVSEPSLCGLSIFLSSGEFSSNI